MSTRRFTTYKKEDREREEEALTTKFHKWLSEGADWCSEVHDRLEENNQYLAGDMQWRKGDIERQEAKGRPYMTLNKVLNVVNAVANREITERFVPKVFGRDRQDGRTAAVLDEILRWERDMSDAEHFESFAFRDLCASGLACYRTYFDELEDGGHGLLKHENIPGWEMVWDSRARQQNLTDRRWHIHGRWVSRIEVEDEFAESISTNKDIRNKLASLRRAESDYDLAMQGSNSTGGRWPWDTIASGKWYNRADDEVFLMEVEWKDVVTIFKAAVPDRMGEYLSLFVDPEAMVAIDDPDAEPNPETGEVEPIEVDYYTWHSMPIEQRLPLEELLLAETSLEEFKNYRELEDYIIAPWFDATGQDFTDWSKSKRYQYRYAFILEDMVLDKGERDGFRIEFLTGYPSVSREGTRFFGIVDVAKGPQDWRNTFMSLILTRLATSPKQMLMIEETAIDDMDYFLDQFANPRGVAVVPDGFVNSNRHMMMDNPTFPPLERELLQMADQGVMEVAGLSGVDMGMQSDLRRISGTVVQSVKEASNTILAIFFDALRRFRKRVSKLSLGMLREFFDIDELQRAIGDDYSGMMQETELMELDAWPELQRYDVKLDEAQTSVTEKLEWWDKMTQTDAVNTWIANGDIPFEVVIDWAPWMTDFDRKRIIEHRGKQTEIQDVQEQLDAIQAKYDALMRSIAAGDEASQTILLRHESEQAAQGQGESETGVPPMSLEGDPLAPSNMPE